MDIHVIKRTISTSGGTGSSNTLPIHGGLARQIFVRAETATTTFRFDLQDEDSVVTRSYDWHTEDINDETTFPMKGQYTMRITDATADGDFTVRISIQQ